MASFSFINCLNLVAYIANFIVTYVSLTGVFGATNTELSNKYQTLVTPAGWAFSIWGPIFIWEGVFVAAQFCSNYRGSMLVKEISPWWWFLCLSQIAWTLAFAQEQIALALIFMICILSSLLGIAWRTDKLHISFCEYILIRAPLSLQLGWILVASVLNVNVLVDSASSSQGVLLAFAVGSIAAIFGAVVFFTFAVESADPFVGFVSAWAFAAISSELNSPSKLNDQTRHNPSEWDSVILTGLRLAALGVSLLALVFAFVAVFRRVCRGYSGHDESSESEEDSELDME